MIFQWTEIERRGAVVRPAAGVCPHAGCGWPVSGHVRSGIRGVKFDNRLEFLISNCDWHAERARDAHTVTSRPPSRARSRHKTWFLHRLTFIFYQFKMSIDMKTSARLASRSAPLAAARRRTAPYGATRCRTVPFVGGGRSSSFVQVMSVVL